jgi:hypothetical protein
MKEVIHIIIKTVLVVVNSHSDGEGQYSRNLI